MREGQLSRVAVTEAAADLLRSLRDLHGPLMIHQSGGCCDGSSPMCYPDGEFLIGESDVRLGELFIGGVAARLTSWTCGCGAASSSTGGTPT